MVWKNRMKSTNGELSDAQIADLELQLGGNLRLPEDYRSFLLSCNGGVPVNTIASVVEDGDESTTKVRWFYGFTGRRAGEKEIETDPCLVERYRRYCLSGHGPKTTVPIAGDDGSNRFVIYCEGSRFGQIWFVTTEGRKFFQAPSFERFFDSLEFDDYVSDVKGPPPVLTTPWERKRKQQERERAEGGS